jgi:hypothetical protein
MPGSHAPVIRGDDNKGVIIVAAEREKLVALRREALEAMAPKVIAPNGAMVDSGNSPAGVRQLGLRPDALVDLAPFGARSPYPRSVR